ncbi:unnamed protein product, partial [Ectocarpus fasciculatus]
SRASTTGARSVVRSGAASAEVGDSALLALRAVLAPSLAVCDSGRYCDDTNEVPCII